jgi:hypothetical protein
VALTAIHFGRSRIKLLENQPRQPAKEEQVAKEDAHPTSQGGDSRPSADATVQHRAPEAQKKNPPSPSAPPDVSLPMDIMQILEEIDLPPITLLRQAASAGEDLGPFSAKAMERYKTDGISAAEDHPGTPWEILAKRALAIKLGLKWEPVR